MDNVAFFIQAKIMDYSAVVFGFYTFNRSLQFANPTDRALVYLIAIQISFALDPKVRSFVWSFSRYAAWFF